MDIQIRPLIVEDAAAITLLSQQLGYPATIDATAERIRHLSQKQDHLALAALSGSSITGWIHALHTFRIESDPFIEIAGLVVDQTCRRQGIGKTLVSQVIAWSREKGNLPVRVRSNTQRAEAHLFYTHTGFTKTKTQWVLDHKPSPL